MQRPNRTIQRSVARVRSVGPVYLPSRASALPSGACGLARSAQPGPRLSPPSQLPTPASHAEPSGGPLETLERVTVWGEGNTWPRANLLCTLFLSQSLSQYFTHPSPTPTSFILPRDGPVHTFLPRLSHVSEPSSQPRSSRLDLPNYQTRPTAGDKYMCVRFMERWRRTTM